MAVLMTATLVPSCAAAPSMPTYAEQEASAFLTLMERIDQAAASSLSFDDFVIRVQSLLNDRLLTRFPAVREVITSLLGRLTDSSSGTLFGLPLDLFNRDGRPGFFVLSFGSYNRLNPRKENTLTVMKDRLSFWHYRSPSRLFEGRTLIIDRDPFSIKQRLQGPQFGFMNGFRGIYIDHESRLSGNSFLFFMGGARHIRAFDLTPLNR
jgi:hypothetical protein